MLIETFTQLKWAITLLSKWYRNNRHSGHKKRTTSREKERGNGRGRERVSGIGRGGCAHCCRRGWTLHVMNALDTNLQCWCHTIKLT